MSHRRGRIGSPLSVFSLVVVPLWIASRTHESVARRHSRCWHVTASILKHVAT